MRQDCWFSCKRALWECTSGDFRDCFIKRCGFISVVITAIMREVNAIFMGLFRVFNGDRYLAPGFLGGFTKLLLWRKVQFVCKILEVHFLKFYENGNKWSCLGLTHWWCEKKKWFGICRFFSFRFYLGLQNAQLFWSFPELYGVGNRTRQASTQI